LLRQKNYKGLELYARLIFGVWRELNERPTTLGSVVKHQLPASHSTTSSKTALSRISIFNAWTLLCTSEEQFGQKASVIRVS